MPEVRYSLISAVNRNLNSNLSVLVLPVDINHDELCLLCLLFALTDSLNICLCVPFPLFRG